MKLAIPHQQRMPLAIAALGFLFLGLFLLYPLFNVFSASVLDSEGEKFTLANYLKVLGRPFYRAAVTNTLTIGVIATITTMAISVPFAFALARLPVAPAWITRLPHGAGFEELARRLLGEG